MLFMRDKRDKTQVCMKKKLINSHYIKLIQKDSFYFNIFYIFILNKARFYSYQLYRIIINLPRMMKKRVSKMEIEKNRSEKKKNLIQEQFNQLSKQYANTNPERFLNAIEKLRVDRLPDFIPCRQNQKHQIQQWIKNSISTKGNHSIFYISGIPGIGKTICVKQVIAKIQKQYSHNYQKNKFIYLNCFQMKKATDIFISLFRSLTEEQNPQMEEQNNKPQVKKKHRQIDSQRALYIINDYFQRQNSEYIKIKGDTNKIIVIDQFDYLQTKDFAVLYNIMEWIQRNKSHLIVIAISNTMDYSQKLPPKLQSRFGKSSVTFRQYSIDQLKEIVASRLKEVKVFTQSAINFLCNKVARQSTDIRKVLFILSESISKYMAIQSKIYDPQDIEYLKYDIPIEIVEETYRDTYKDVFTQSFAQFPSCYKKVLLVMACYFRGERQKLVYSHLEFLCGDMIKRTNQLRSILYDLRDLGLIKFDYQVLIHDNRVEKNFQLDKQVEEQHITLLVQVDKILIAKSNDQTEIKYPSYVIQKI